MPGSDHSIRALGGCQGAIMFHIFYKNEPDHVWELKFVKHYSSGGPGLAVHGECALHVDLVVLGQGTREGPRCRTCRAWLS